MHFPGSWNYSKISYLCSMMELSLNEDYIPPEYAILCDSAFPVNSGVVERKLLRARKSSKYAEIPISPEMLAIDIIVQQIYGKERQ